MRRAGPPREIPPPLELDCMRALWRVREGSVKDVMAVMGESRPLAYTTVMTLLDRLERRGFASRRKHGRAFLYAPVLPEDRARAIAVQDVVEGWFGGSREALREYLVSQERAERDPEPVEEARQAPRIDTTLL